MTTQEMRFLILLVINLIITLIYLIINLFRKEDNRRSFLIRVFVMLLFPITGPLVFFIGYILFLLFFHKEVDLADVVFSKERVSSLLHADEDRERNLVPIEEAIAVTDKADLRALMLNVARSDTQKSLSTIALALDSEDSEAAHYAASILQDELNDFRATVQKNYLYMKENEEERPEYAHMLIGYMDQVLKQQVFTEMEQKNQVYVLDDIGEMLYTHEDAMLTSNEFEAVSMRLLEIKDFERCKKWCDRAAVQYPNVLSTYTCQLKLYFTMEEKDRFFEILNSLKESAVEVDSETLEMIRVFS